MKKEEKRVYDAAASIAEAIAKVLDEYNDLTMGSHVFALRTALISILHYFSYFDTGGGIDLFFDSLRREYEKAHAALEQMDNAEKNKYN